MNFKVRKLSSSSSSSSADSSDSNEHSIQEIPFKKVKKTTNFFIFDCFCFEKLKKNEDEKPVQTTSIITQNNNQMITNPHITQIKPPPPQQQQQQQKPIQNTKLQISSSSSSSPILLLNNIEHNPQKIATTATVTMKPKVANNLATTVTSTNLTSTTNDNIISPATFNHLSDNLKKILLRIQSILQTQKPLDGVWSPEIKNLFLK